MMPSALRHLKLRLGLLALLLAGLGACATSVPIRYYLLTPSPGEGQVVAASTARRPASSGSGRFVIAPYLDRAEVVMRGADTRIAISDLDRWGEKLDGLIARVTAANLTASLRSTDIVLLPTSFDVRPARELVIEIDRFDSDAQGHVTLTGRWQLIEPRSGDATAGSRIAVAEEAGAMPSYDAITAAMSRALGTMASQIATAAR